MTTIIMILALLVGSAIGWFAGGLITGIIYTDAAIDHKICWTICGIAFGLFVVICLFYGAYQQ